MVKVNSLSLYLLFFHLQYPRAISSKHYPSRFCESISWGRSVIEVPFHLHSILSSMQYMFLSLHFVIPPLLWLRTINLRPTNGFMADSIVMTDIYGGSGRTIWLWINNKGGIRRHGCLTKVCAFDVSMRSPAYTPDGLAYPIFLHLLRFSTVECDVACMGVCGVPDEKVGAWSKWYRQVRPKRRYKSRFRVVLQLKGEHQDDRPNDNYEYY